MEQQKRPSFESKKVIQITVTGPTLVLGSMLSLENWDCFPNSSSMAISAETVPCLLFNNTGCKDQQLVLNPGFATF